MINGPRDLESGDRIRIFSEAVKGVEFRVSDVEVEDIGITEVFTVSLLTPTEQAYALTGTTSDAYATLQRIEDEKEDTVFWQSVELV